MLFMLRRERALLEFGLASLLRRPGKAAVLCAVLTLIVFLLSSLAFLRSSVRLEARIMLRDVPDLVVQRMVAGRQELLTAEAAPAVRGVPGVARVTERLWGYYYDPAAGANYTVVVPAFSAPLPGQAAIGSGIARSRQGYSRE